VELDMVQTVEAETALQKAVVVVVQAVQEMQPQQMAVMVVADQALVT
jgi:hypothetical protein